MKLSVATNICRLRKEHSLTQEQLAEALDVTFAAVSKWERGIATPELHLIARMADLFGVSVDAIIGFEVVNGNVEALENKIRALQHQKAYSQAVAEAEKALLRYPNNFRIVYRSGELYAVAGIELKNETYLHRCIELLEHSVLLLSQNTEPETSEASIKNKIAQCYIALDNHELGLEILKKYNVMGANNALLAMTYTSSPNHSPKDAEPYILGALGNAVTSAVSTMTAYASYHCSLHRYAEARAAHLWLANMLESIKRNRNTVAYVDKVIASCYAECAGLSLKLGEQAEAEAYLRHAHDVAKSFDAAPTYKLENVKFCVGDIDNATAYDDLGESAAVAVEKRLTQRDGNGQLLTLWRSINENT